MENIDFVITWVDGNDKKWQEDKAKYSHNKFDDIGNNRYRDFGVLKYWFRGVEKYAPWVNKIHFVTYGHVPKFLNLNNPKLNIVKHEDFIPKKYLPTFSSHPIELNMHRIPNLAEQFVYFNDDMFVFNKVFPKDFFVKNKPRDVASINIPLMKKYKDFNCIQYNNIGIINSIKTKKEILKSNFFKWYNLKYGVKLLLRNMLLPPFKYMPVFYHHHANSNFLKSTFEEMWKLEPEILDATCSHKFRNNSDDVNQWLMKDWQIANGNFVPIRGNFSKYYEITTELNLKKVFKSKAKVICLNDCVDDEHFDEKMNELNKYFQKKLPNKSSFEI